MNNSHTSETFDERDDYPKITQADLDRATFRVGLKPAPRKRRVTILLDTGLIEYFKAKAGERGYQTLINDTLRQAVERDDLEESLRHSFRTRKDRKLELTSVYHECAPGHRKVAVKVVDIFGNDTMTIVEVNVGGKV